MIKAVILDVDGVIVGEKMGVNAPYPNIKVTQRLGDVRNKGIFVSLCTAKPYYSVEKIIRDGKLDNLHITNGGGEITNPLREIILKKHIVNRLDVKKVLKKYLDDSVYMEFYSIDNYYIQKNQISGISKTHELILQKPPVVVESLINEAEIQDVIKIMAVSEDEKDSKRLTEMFAPFLEALTLSWGIHPVALPHRFGIITAKGISKKQAVAEIAHAEGIKETEILGIGDSTSDWQFIEGCGFAGTVANASDELKELVKTKGEENYFIGKSVDDDGILDIFGHFNL